MVKIASTDRESITLTQTSLNPLYEVSPNWYCPLYRCFTNVRYCQLKRVAEDWLYKALLNDNKLRLYTTISHEPIVTEADRERIAAGKTTLSQIADRQRVKDADRDDYIDEFGRYVYLQTAVGYSQDMDLRYDGVPDPELFTMQYIEDDLRDRKPDRAVC
jgi:hypothetical protein